MDIQKQKFGFGEEHFKDLILINNDLKYLVKYYFVIDTFLLINSLLTYLQANSLDQKDVCNIVFNEPLIDIWIHLLSRSCDYFLWLYPIFKMFKKPQHMKSKLYYEQKRNKLGGRLKQQTVNDDETSILYSLNTETLQTSSANPTGSDRDYSVQIIETNMSPMGSKGNSIMGSLIYNDKNRPVSQMRQNPE